MTVIPLQSYDEVFPAGSGPGFDTLTIVIEHRICQGNKLVQCEDDFVGQVRIKFCHLDSTKEEGVSWRSDEEHDAVKENRITDLAHK